ncbi:MAG: ABC transporter permease [Verrucomicrobia bacterium]|nr:ABC transporter permease [Verrucomicrobiota bacterium]MBS0645676.1 ABC transporter permease [Verrucomicrobiota bacterium]
MHIESYRRLLWKQFRKNPVGLGALCILSLFLFIAIYAPLFASSKPLCLIWDGQLYFPLFRYLFYRGFFSKPIDLFYNLLMLTLPCTLLLYWLVKKTWVIFGMMLLHFCLFAWLLTGPVKNPEGAPNLVIARQQALEAALSYREDPLLTPLTPYPGWSFELKYMTNYAKIILLLQHKIMLQQQERLHQYAEIFYHRFGREMPTLWNVSQRNEQEKREALEQQIQQTQDGYEQAMSKLPDLIARYTPYSHQYLMAKLEHQDTQLLNLTSTKFTEAQEIRNALVETRKIAQGHRDALASLTFLQERTHWIDSELSRLHIIWPSLLRPFHWEDDAGGAQAINQIVPWWERSRINRKDLVSSLIFGIRVSIVVGIGALLLSLFFGIPLGACSGYFAGKLDLVICRLVEIWEAMPTFFMLLLIIALTQSKSIFLVITVLGIFGWTNFARFMRAEVLKQRHLSYVYACTSLGFDHKKILFSHILPNAIPPILTLIPFAMMAAISGEAGLSFLGLGEEGATSWGVLMDEGRSVFPAESYLLWPPALLLTILLVCIALVGDVIRDALDPKLRS